MDNGNAPICQLLITDSCGPCVCACHLLLANDTSVEICPLVLVLNVCTHVNVI